MYINQNGNNRVAEKIEMFCYNQSELRKQHREGEEFIRDRGGRRRRFQRGDVEGNGVQKVSMGCSRGFRDVMEGSDEKHVLLILKDVP